MQKAHLKNCNIASVIYYRGTESRIQLLCNLFYFLMMKPVSHAKYYFGILIDNGVYMITIT